MNRLLEALARYGYFDALALAIIALCGVAHLINAINSASPFQAVMPVWGVVACIAYGLLCHAWTANGLVKLLFVAGGLTSFWMQ